MLRHDTSHFLSSPFDFPEFISANDDRLLLWNMIYFCSYCLDDVISVSVRQGLRLMWLCDPPSHLRLRPGSPLWPPRPAHASVRRRPQTALSGAQGRTLWRPADQRIISWTWQLSAAQCLRVAFFMLWNVCVNLENISPGIQEINVFCLQLKLNLTIMEVLPPRRGVICAATDSTQGVLHRK